MSRRRKKAKPGEKHIYSAQEIVFSPGWRTEDFRLADKQREILRDEKNRKRVECLGDLFGLIEDLNIVSFSHLVRYVYAHRSDLAQTLKESSTYVRYYVDSRRFDISCGFVDMPYNKVCEMLKHAETHIHELDEKIGFYIQTLSTNRDDIKRLELENAQLKQSIYEQQLFTKHLLDTNNQLRELLEYEEIKLD